MSGAHAEDWASKGVPNSIMLTKPFAPAQLLKGLMNVGSLVVIEPSTALHAKAALGDHLLQQNARLFGQAGPVLGIVLFDAQHHVEAHRVHEAEGAGL